MTVAFFDRIMALFNQFGQIVHTQTNIAGNIWRSVFSGHFEIQGDFIYNEATRIRLPFFRPGKIAHFIGREDELAALVRDLQSGRTVTICGPGGIGKTALAIEAIWQIAPKIEPPKLFPDGIIFYSFYHRPQAPLAAEAIAKAYGEDPHQDPFGAAERALAGRQALIVLDGAEACDDLRAVLSITSSCGVLITTRRHSDAPADFTDLSPLPEDKAVELLQAWSGRMASDTMTCQNICSLLGGLPLAIFLTGRYMSHRSQFAADYLAWLEKTPLVALDLGKRQHESIPLLMKHSLAQVSDKARKCLGIAGVLALRPFEPEIIALALNTSLENANRSLGELVDFGMLIRPDVHYSVTHALAHTYAREEITDSKNLILNRLAKYYEDLAYQNSQRGLKGYSILDDHRAHILSVQQECLKYARNSKANQDYKAVINLTNAIQSYLELRGYWTDLILVLRLGLNAAYAIDEKEDMEAFLTSLGITYAFFGKYPLALRLHTKALEIAKEIGDRQREGKALGKLGFAYKNIGNISEAIEYYEKALIIDREIGDRKEEGITLMNLGIAYVNLGEINQGIEFFKEALSIARELNDEREEAKALGCLGSACYDLHKTKNAIRYHNQCRIIAKKIGDRESEGEACGNLGLAFADLKKMQRALAYFNEAVYINHKIRNRREEGKALAGLGVAYIHCERRPEAEECFKNALAIMHEIGYLRGEGKVLINMGVLSENNGDYQEAEKLYEDSAHIFHEIGDKHGEGNALYRAALALYQLDDTDKAINSMRSALRLYEQINNPSANEAKKRLDDWTK